MQIDNKKFNKYIKKHFIGKQGQAMFEVDSIVSMLKSLNEKVASLGQERDIELVNKVYLTGGMVFDYLSGDDIPVSHSTIGLSVVSLLYFVAPVDLVADFIPVLGYTDDLSLILA